MDIKEILKQAAGDVLTEETLTAIDSAFTTAVDSKVEAKAKEQLTLQVEQALTKQDDEHTEKLGKLLEAVDADHVMKLKTVVAKLDESHCGKLTFIVKKYRNQLQTEAAKLRDTLVNEVSNFLDLYLDKVAPTEQISEAVANTEARKMLEAIKKVIAVDSSFITEQVREALVDGKQKINALQNQLDGTIKENVELNKAKKTAEANLILEKKTQGLPEDKKIYVNKVLAEKDPEFITENFNYVVEMFERDEQDEVELIEEAARNGSVTRNIDQPVAKEADGNQAATPVNGYLSELERTESRSRRSA